MPAAEDPASRPEAAAPPRVARRAAPRGEDSAPELADDALTRFERANSEFEDLPPGALLGEQRVGPVNVGWATVNLGLVLGVLLGWHLGGLPRDGAWWLQSRVVWTLLPFSCAILGLWTLWQQAVGEEGRSSAYRLTLFLTAFALALRLGGSWWLGIDFGDLPQPPPGAGPGLDPGGSQF